MDKDLSKFSIFGLYLAAVAAVGSGIYYFLQREFNIPLQIGLVLVVAGLTAFTALDPERVRIFLGSRQFKYGNNSLFLIIGVIGILVVVNFIANKYSVEWDLTEDQSNTLAPETISALKSLPEKITALAFFTPAASSEKAENLLSNMKENSSGMFDYQFIDPEADPIRVQKYNITNNSSIVLTMGEKMQPVANSTELEVMTSIIKLIDPTQYAVYFLTGHGEHDPFGSDELSYSALNNALINKNYKVNILNLLATSQIPADAKVIVIAGPVKPVSQMEVNLLKQFVDSGNSLLVLENLMITTNLGIEPDSLAAYLEADWGISLQNEMVINPNSQNPYFIVAQEYSDSAIVSSLRQRKMATIFPYSGSVLAAETPPANISLTPLMRSAQNSWGERDSASLENNIMKYDESVDTPGPVTLAVAGANSATNARVVVVSSSLFVISANFNQYGNGEFITNAIDWSAKADQLISITPRNATQRMMVPPQSLVINLLVLVSVILIPVLILVIGIVVSIQRKKRG
ncbi:MAG: hypothetical protein C0391_04630 [Anaerolinea sp.]|nr:hypothetical protein [Anaerolinea sp.]